VAFARGSGARHPYVSRWCGVGSRRGYRIPCVRTDHLLAAHGDFVMALRQSDLSFRRPSATEPLGRYPDRTLTGKSIAACQDTPPTMPTPAPLTSDPWGDADPWREAEGTHIPLRSRVEQVAVDIEHGALTSRLHQQGQVVSRGTLPGARDLRPQQPTDRPAAPPRARTQSAGRSLIVPGAPVRVPSPKIGIPAGQEVCLTPFSVARPVSEWSPVHR
jgi:hypothetical protein